MRQPSEFSLNDEAVAAIAAARHGDPFAVLGPHETAQGTVVCTAQPGAQAVVLESFDGARTATLEKIHPDGIFAGISPRGRDYRLVIDWGTERQTMADPYNFGPLLGDTDMYLLAEGRHFRLDEALGAQAMEIGGIKGVRFAVWAPNAMRVSVVGGFNTWDGRRHPMRLRHGAGVWELFVPGVAPGELYRFEILTRDGAVLSKSDPIALRTEGPPATASIVADPTPFRWTDEAWIAGRGDPRADRPMAIYEVHAASWRRHGDGRPYLWRELADTLIPYVVDLGYTHIEFLPVMAHPFGGSWGYQPLSLFAPMPALGSPAEFAEFVDRCHGAGIGVILDWVPAHFPTDPHGMVRFDGTALYEHEDPREGFHRDWNTLIYNFGRHEVRNFLIASALCWLKRYHVDGLRVDAVASMLYRDYSREAGDWVPNRYGGRENLEAINFLKELSQVIDDFAPGTLLIAEESTAWPGVSNTVENGGLGFSQKWNMGWMHDTLHYIEKDPVHRQYQHDDMTFGLVYAFTERFVLPISHDEVVYGKHSLLGKMPGDRWQRFANLRAYLGFMWTQPGKKLLFMGQEFGQEAEWNHDAELGWFHLDDDAHRGVQALFRDLNRLYRAEPALSTTDFDPNGFRWIVGDDRAQSVFAWYRMAGDPPLPGNAVVVAANFTPVPRHAYRIGVPAAGAWREILNTDSAHYGGSDLGNQGRVDTEPTPSHGLAQSLTLTLPPLGLVVLKTAS